MLSLCADNFNFSLYRLNFFKIACLHLLGRTPRWPFGLDDHPEGCPSGMDRSLLKCEATGQHADGIVFSVLF